MSKTGACRLALMFCFALTVVVSTVRAESSSNLTFYISGSIAEDSAAARAAQRWATTVHPGTRLKLERLTVSGEDITSTHGAVLAPLRHWSKVVPAMDVLRLPFLYKNLKSVHNAIDSELYSMLAQATRQAGWKLLAIWDAGMTDFSGNQRYNRLQNLSGMTFALWEHDSVVEAELRALDVWTRVIGERGVQSMAKECLVNSRSATPAQMRREKLARVHLDLTLTNDRYTGFVLAVPIGIWNKLTTAQRDNMTKKLSGITTWERTQAAREQTQAVKALRKAGMQVHEFNASQRQTFSNRMPPWRDFLDRLDAKTANDLIAAARAAATTGGSDGGAEKTLTNPLQATQTTK